MTDILNQIDAVLADVTACQCGCGAALSPTGPSPWFVNEVHQANWYLLPGVLKSGIEEESAGAEVFPAPLGAPVATGDSSPEGRRQFVADVAAFHAASVAGTSWPPVDPEPAPRPTFTLADMEEASAAVQARREAALRDGVERVIERVEAEVSARFAPVLPPGYTVTFDRTPLLPARRWNLSTECGATTPARDCQGCDGGAIDGFTCMHECHGEASEAEAWAAANPAFGQRVTLAEVTAPADEPLQPAPGMHVDPPGIRQEDTGLYFRPPVDRGSWWRRMLGGGTR